MIEILIEYLEEKARVDNSYSSRVQELKQLWGYQKN